MPFCQKPISSPKPKKLAQSRVNISLTDMDKFEVKELMKKRLF